MRSPRSNRLKTVVRLSVAGICLAGLECMIALGVFATAQARAETRELSKFVADSLLTHGVEAGTAPRMEKAWSSELGWQVEGLNAAWYNTAKGDYFRYGKARIDALLDSTSNNALSISVTDAIAANLMGRELVLLARVTLAPRYFEAATAVRRQLAPACGMSTAGSTDARASGACTAQPFLAEYASVFQHPEDFVAITRSFEKRSRTIAALTADRADRAQALFAEALVDALPYYPEDDPGRAAVIGMLQEAATRLIQWQQSSRFAGSASQTIDQPAACLAVYALAKGVRLGYLPVSDAAIVQRSWQSIVRRVHLDANGAFTVPESAGTASAEEGSGVGSLLVAAAEMDHTQTAQLGRGQTVLLDAWYNSQQHKNAAGEIESFHYKWTDRSDSGYSLFGDLFRSFGVATRTLSTAPTKDNLRGAQFYLVVSPDIPVKNPTPHYMNEKDAAEVADWVRAGGVLILMENDPPNADIDHLNLLADRFGIHFDDVLHHHILGEKVEDGRIPVTPHGRLFRHPHTFYMKDTCTISLRKPAVALLHDRGDVVMATAHYGRGAVFAAVDPWLYNEYTDGRKNPQIYDQFDNFAGGQELVRWLIERRSH
jgi:unsaturated rhamnogalacturonyl hydrolase